MPRVFHLKPAQQGAVLVLLSAVLFSSKSIFIKLAYGLSVAPITLLFLRMAFALPFFLSMVWFSERREKLTLHRRDWAVLALLGFSGYYMASLLDFMGLVYISAGLERLVLFIYPTLTVLLSAALTRQRISMQAALAIAVTYVGMLLVVWQDLQQPQANIWLGVMLVFVSALAYASYLVGSAGMIERIGATRFTGIALSIASVCALLHFAIAHHETLPLFSADLLLLGATLGIVCTVMPATLLTQGMRRIGASRAALIGTVGPVATLWLAYLVLGETVTALQILGTATVLLGVLWVSVQRH